MERNNKLKVSIILNLIIFVSVVIGTVFTLFDVDLHGAGLLSSGFGYFKFFTVQSNVLMGIFAGVFLVYEFKFLNGRINKIPNVLYGLKLIFTVGVTLTFLTVVCYLGIIIPTGFFSLFLNANFFFHFLVPVLSIITFIFFESRPDLKFSYTFIGLSHFLLYGVFYVTNVFTHLDGGKVLPEYDFYNFVWGENWSMLVTVSVMLIITYGISFLLWFINRKTYRDKSKAED